MNENIKVIKLEDALLHFQQGIVDDPRVGPTHISLYAAIIHLLIKQGCTNPITFFGRELMRHAKISGSATYSKCIQDLKEFGFIEYIPSYNPLLGSIIYLQVNRA